MNKADEAYEKALALIEESIAEGNDYLELDMAGSDLAAIPPEISNATHITRLDLINTQVADLSPISGMNGIIGLVLSSTQVTDLSPIARLNGITTLNFSNTQVTDLSPIAGLDGITTLDLSNTQVADLSPIAGMNGITRLYLSGTQVADLSPIARLNGITRLHLSGTQVADLSPIAGMNGITVLDLEGTAVQDISPLPKQATYQFLDLMESQVRDLRPLADLKTIELTGGIFFRVTNTPAAKADPRITEIDAIEDDAERVKTLQAYLRDWVPPGEGVFTDVDEASEISDFEIPPAGAAPIKITASEDSVEFAHGSGLSEPDANTRAQMGWEALKDYREDLANAFQTSNYAPLPSYLAAFDRAMGVAYDPSRVVRIGTQVQRLARLALDKTFLANLPDGAADDLRGFAADGLVYIERFPDWVLYVADAQVIRAQDVVDASQMFEEIRAALTETEGVSADVAEEFAQELAQVLEDDATEIEGQAVTSSTREITRELAEYESQQRRKQQKQNRKLAESGGEFVEGVVLGPVGVPLHLMKRMEQPLRKLAERFPRKLGWVSNWYDLTFGKDDDQHDD